ncbi:MAG: PDZ domain-containing protein [Armatimonadetes bacterium]|nr:PDZ domain-containing protein [Armatimonadota bacterium]
MRGRLPLLALFSAFATVSLADTIVGARWLALSPDGSKIAFSYQGDVWVAPSNGGKAIPITDNVEMDDRPVWSPDGKQIAFASDRYGNNDVFVVDSDGGRPKRITYNTGSDIPSSWTADGKSILMMRRLDDAYRGIYSVDVDSGSIHEFFLDQMPIEDPQGMADGRILYGRLGFPWERPRYQGSDAQQMWIFDPKTDKRIQVRNNGYQHLWPQTSASGMYAVTMTDPVASSSPLGKSIGRVTFTVGGTPNVYKIDANGSAKRLTNYSGDGTRFLTASRDGNTLAFERNGDVYVMKPGAEPHMIEMTANVDDKVITEEHMVLTDGARGATLSPDGSTILFNNMSEVWSVPVKKGEGPNKDDATQLTDWAGIDDVQVFSPDGKSAYIISDRDDSERLYKLDLATKKVTMVSTQDAQVDNVKISPDKKYVVYQQYGANGGIYRAPVDGGAPEMIVSRPGRSDLEYSFSPDGRYIAYVETLQGSGFYYWDAGNNVFVVDLTDGKKHNVTQTNQSHSSPVWSADGKYLYFRRDNNLFALPLQPESYSSPESKMKYTKPTGMVKVTIDFDDIETRERQITTGVNSTIQVNPEDGTFFYVGGDGIYRADYNGENAKRITGPGGFELSEDGKSLLSIQGGKLFVTNLKANGFPTQGVDFRGEYTRDLKKTREAAFHQFWRGFNNGFYDPNFHGRDWVALGKKYERLLPSVGTRNEMATLLFMLVGELESSHSEVSPGPGGNKSQSSAHLGFSWDYSYSGPGIKVKDVPKRSPVSYEKSLIKPGEIVLQINGKDVSTNEAVFRDVLNDQAGRDVTLTVKGTDGKTRDVTYEAISPGQYAGIVGRNRLEANRKYVESKSGGNLTYVHIAGMDARNLQLFQQQIWQYAPGKKGVIIDVRGNGGGNTADQIIDILERRQNMNYVPRDEAAMRGPGTVLDVPIIVMMDESSYSNAEMFPEAMRARKLAKLVGHRTPGYVIYTGGFRLVDGTNARMPGTGVWRVDGSSMEDNGVKPDYEADLTPEEFFTGQDPQLDKAIQVLSKG